MESPLLDSRIPAGGAVWRPLRDAADTTEPHMHIRGSTSPRAGAGCSTQLQKTVWARGVGGGGGAVAFGTTLHAQHAGFLGAAARLTPKVGGATHPPNPTPTPRPPPLRQNESRIWSNLTSPWVRNLTTPPQGQALQCLRRRREGLPRTKQQHANETTRKRPSPLPLKTAPLLPQPPPRLGTASSGRWLETLPEVLPGGGVAGGVCWAGCLLVQHTCPRCSAKDALPGDVGGGRGEGRGGEVRCPSWLKATTF